MKAISASEYRHISEFRYRIRQFLQFSEQAARDHGIDPQQHQLLLAVKGLPEDLRPTVRAVAERLCIRHHSAVELIHRCVMNGYISKEHSAEDAREVLIALTRHGEQLLQKLSMLHWQELQNSGPSLVESLRAIVLQTPLKRKKSA